MIKLPPPVCTAVDTFGLCIDGFSDRDLKKRLKAIGSVIAAEAAAYEAALGEQRAHTVERHDSVSNVSRQDLIKIYDQKMARIGERGRPIYDLIKMSAQNDVCPLCARRKVQTLDHYLPKKYYPVHSVNPLNLIPACSDCNKIKYDFFPKSAEDALMHPYFDDLKEAMWLRATVVEKTPTALKFFVDKAAIGDRISAERVARHFEKLQLAALYSFEAADELSAVMGDFKRVFSVGGSEELRAYIQEQAQSRRANRVNSWRTAAYTAWANSDWFVNGGFE